MVFAKKAGIGMRADAGSSAGSAAVVVGVVVGVVSPGSWIGQSP